MKVEVFQEKLEKALVACSRIATNKVQLPILANILMKVVKNQLMICSTNLEISLASFIGVKVEKEGEITVPAKVITDIVSNLKSSQITLSTEKEVLNIVSNGYEANISGMNASEFPSIPSELGAKTLNLPREKFLDALNSTLFSVSNDETRPQLTGILLFFKKNEMFLVSTDGFRLSQKKIKNINFLEEEKIILPKSCLLELSRMVESENIDFSYKKNERQAVFGFSNFVLSSRIIEGSFPDYERIIPRDTKVKVNLDKEEFLRAIKLASVFARDSANVIKLEFSENELQVLAESTQTGYQKTKVLVKTQGLSDKFLIAFNYRFLEDFLNSIKGEELRMEFTDPFSPALFLDTQDENLLHIIMPVRLTE